MAPLSAAQVKQLREPGRYGDGGGLSLHISPGRTKSWVLRFRLDGKRVDRGLGSFPRVSLSEARKLARAAQNGDAPRRESSGAVALVDDAMPTFRQGAMLKHQLKVEGGEITNAKHIDNWIAVLLKHTPALHSKRLDDITQADVIATLRPLWNVKPETAKRVRFRIREVFNWAMGFDYVPRNPAGDGINGALGKQKRKAKHFDAMPYDEVREALYTFERSQALREIKLAFRFVVLTACRTGEVRGMTWDEVDLDGADGPTLRIAGERMKTGKEHRVPLSEQSCAVLRDAERAVQQRRKRYPDFDPHGIVFPSQKGTPLGPDALLMRFRKFGYSQTIHGFRSSFKDWTLEQTDTPWRVSEAALAHVSGTPTEQAYARSDLFERRRALMQQWADFVLPNLDPFLPPEV